MSTRHITDRDLPRLLGEVDRGAYPAYIHDVLAATARSGQRPVWTFPGRWLPLDVVAPTPAFGGRMASTWPILVLLAILALAAVGSAILAAGARQQKLPPPFAPARNGVIVTIDGGTLMEVDPVARTAVPLLEGAAYMGPEFSPDGGRLLFFVSSGEGIARFHVMNADGSGVQELLPEGYRASWAPDSDRIAIGHEGRLAIHDVERGVTLWHDLGIEGLWLPQWRPNHDQLLVESILRLPSRDGIGIPVEHLDWYLVNADGTGLRSVPGADGIWSPDGSTIAYQASDGRVHLLEIDTGVDRELTFNGSEGTGESPVSFSPDGSKLLITRSLLDKDIAPSDFPDEYCCRSPWLHVVVPVAGAGPAIVLGPDEHRSLGGPGGSAIWSPDGTSVLAVYTQTPVGAWLFDAATGRGEEMPEVTSAWTTWQRLAP